MTLLREIQAAAVDPTADLPSLLRKCKVLATRLRSEQVKLWLDRELNGYDSIDDLPSYRKLRVQSLGNFTGPLGISGKGMPISMHCIPEKFRERLQHTYLTQPISGIVDLVSGEPGDNSMESWPAEIVAHVADKIYEDMNCVSAWKVIPRNVLVGIVDTVRTRVLNFALEIEQEAPDAGEAPANSTPVPQDRISQIFNTYVYGTGHNVAAGGENVKQVSTVNVTQGDLSSLKRALATNGMSAADLEELERAVREDEAKEKGVPFGKRVTEWMGKALRKAGTETWKIAREAAGSLLTKALSGYYGLD